MSSYEDGIRNSIANLSDAEILFRLKNDYYTEEAKKIVEEELQKRGADIKSEAEIKESEVSYETLINEDRVKKFKNGNAAIWAISLFMFGVAQMQMARTSPPLINGIIYVMFGFPIYLLVVKIKNEQWTNEALLKKYRSNFATLLTVLGIALLSVVLKIYFLPFALPIILDLSLLGVMATLILSKKKIGKQIMAVYALCPILATIIWGNWGNIIVWPFAFFASAQSLLIQSILSKDSEE